MIKSVEFGLLLIGVNVGEKDIDSCLCLGGGSRRRAKVLGKWLFDVCL